MSQHTQGSWMACVADAGHLVVGPDGYAVCALPAIVRTPDEQSANAELIAMAPNLLVRLAHLVDVMPRADAEFGSGEIVYVDDYGAALEKAQTLLDLLAESGVIPGETS